MGREGGKGERPSRLFDFSSGAIQDWEVRHISEAALALELEMSDHATKEAIADGVDVRDIREIAARGEARWKDLPQHRTRAAGINYEGGTPSGRRIRFKVGESEDGANYQVVTVHNVGRRG